VLKKKLVLKIGFFVQKFSNNVMVVGLKLVQFAQKMMEIAIFSRGPYALFTPL
jgi:hypothetical protein